MSRSGAASWGHVLMAAFIAVACQRPLIAGEPADPIEVAQRPNAWVAVVDSEQRPVADVWVTLSPGGRDARTGPLGVALFAGLEEGDYTAAVHVPGASAEPALFTVGADRVAVALHAVPLALPPGLAGVVLDADGSPLAGVGVHIDEVLAATTDADGHYEALELPAGFHSVQFIGPLGQGHRSYSLPAISIGGDAVRPLHITLPGAPKADATFIGSDNCMLCHGASSFTQTLHYRSARDPIELAGDPSGIDRAFLDGTVVDLGALVSGASVVLGATSASDWTAEVRDGSGGTTGPLPVREVYGGHSTGAAFAVEHDGRWRVLPTAWAAAGQGLSSQQHTATFGPAWTQGWFDGAALSPSAASDFDLQCAGCHATGHRLTESASGFALDGVGPLDSVERRVGCEACHGAGSTHRTSSVARSQSITHPGRLPGVQRVEVCARCHSAASPDAHPFSQTPPWAMDADGVALRPNATLVDHATEDGPLWLEVNASRGPHDQAAEFRLSPHQRGPNGYDGACSDCHKPHGSSHRSDLRNAPGDNSLCLRCHTSRFPDDQAQADHSNHSRFEPGEWSPGSCTGCHMGRSGLSVRADAVTGVGELHSHSLSAWHPDEVLAEFDAAGSDTLPLSDVPTNGCLDCHLNVAAQATDDGGICACPQGDLTRRITYENLGSTFDSWWGSSE